MASVERVVHHVHRCGIITIHKPHIGTNEDGSKWECDGTMLTVYTLVRDEAPVESSPVAVEDLDDYCAMKEAFPSLQYSDLDTWRKVTMPATLPELTDEMIEKWSDRPEFNVNHRFMFKIGAMIARSFLNGEMK